MLHGLAVTRHTRPARRSPPMQLEEDRLLPLPPARAPRTTYHGSIAERGILPIARDGLRGYASSDGTRFCDNTLVTPSWVIALEMYGFDYSHGTQRFRVAFQVRVKHDSTVKKMGDTAFGHQRDWSVPRSEVEWAVPASNCAVTGVIVKQYHTAAAQHQLVGASHCHRRYVLQTGGAALQPGQHQPPPPPAA